MSCEVIIGDAGSPWRLVVRDVGCYQGAGVEANMSYRMPKAKTDSKHLKYETYKSNYDFCSFYLCTSFCETLMYLQKQSHRRSYKA